MKLPPYPVLCYAPGCKSEAAYKIAARWSDGVTDELKTYFLACERCVKSLYPLALARRSACRLAVGESIDRPAVYEWHRGSSDAMLRRRAELEASEPVG